jgi:hypothetical protein
MLGAGPRARDDVCHSGRIADPIRQPEFADEVGSINDADGDQAASGCGAKVTLFAPVGAGDAGA